MTKYNTTQKSGIDSSSGKVWKRWKFTDTYKDPRVCQVEVHCGICWHLSASLWCSCLFRCKYHNNAVTSHLSAAKSKVAPLTPMTVPRLELMGTILGLCLTHSLLTVLEVLHPPYKMASSGVTGVSRSQSSFPTTPNVQSFCLADPGWQNWLWRIVMREEIVPLEKTSFFASWVRDFGSSPHVRRSASGTMNLMNARKDGTSQLVRLWYHSRRQGNGLLSSPSPKQPWIFQVLCILFKDTENLDRKGGCASLTCYEARAVHL